MKKTTELKVRIAGRWIATTIEWTIATIIVAVLLMHSGASLGWVLITPVPIGLFIASPFLAHNDEIIRHYEKILRRKEGK